MQAAASADALARAFPDERTLVLTLAEKGSPSFLLYCLSALVGSVVDKKTVMAHAAGDDLGNGWLKGGNSAGSGPFQLRQWRASESVVPEGFWKVGIV